MEDKVNDLDKRVSIVEQLLSERTDYLKNTDQEQWKEITAISKDMRLKDEILLSELNQAINETKQFVVKLVSVAVAVLSLIIALVKVL